MYTRRGHGRDHLPPGLKFTRPEALIGELCSDLPAGTLLQNSGCDVECRHLRRARTATPDKACRIEDELSTPPFTPALARSTMRGCLPPGLDLTGPGALIGEFSSILPAGTLLRNFG